MSDDFGTMNMKRGDRGREIDLMRQHYRRHRDSLGKMITEAPTEHLATEYQRLIRDIDASLRKLDELEGPSPSNEATQRVSASGMLAVPAVRSIADVALADDGVHPTGASVSGGSLPLSNEAPSAISRVMLIMIAGIVVLSLIGFIIYHASSERRHPDSAIPATETSRPDPGLAIVPATAAPEPAAGGIMVVPNSADYGTIRKGTRAVRQFDVKNLSDAPIDINVARSVCRCLFYEYRQKSPIAPKGKETVTVTVDAARVKGGLLNESVLISSKKDPSLTASFRVIAKIQ